MTAPCIDKVGQEIRVGSIIAYGHALGRCAGIRIGRVLKITQKAASAYLGGDLLWRITVIGVDDDWEHRPLQLNTRVGTLQFPSRIVVLLPCQVPEKHRVLLEGYDAS